MRLYLLPLSTGRTLLYAQRLNLTKSAAALNSAKPSYVDKAVAAAAKKWSEWEKKEAGWQRKVVDYGNQAFRRIPYQEWGLKSVPPLSAARRDMGVEDVKGIEKVELVFPGGTIKPEMAEGILERLATEREGLHRKRLVLSVVAMPFTIPVGLLPVIPNLPFIYLCYRAWSHWRAINGGRHIQWLMRNKLVELAPSPTLDRLYASNNNNNVVDNSSSSGSSDEASGRKQRMLLTSAQVQEFSDALDFPALAIELERAVYQVEADLGKEDGVVDGEKKVKDVSGDGEKEKKP